MTTLLLVWFAFGAGSCAKELQFMDLLDHPGKVEVVQVFNTRVKLIMGLMFILVCALLGPLYLLTRADVCRSCREVVRLRIWRWTILEREDHRGAPLG